MTDTAVTVTDPTCATDPGEQPTRTLDALVIGAGVAGLYQLHQLRELGLEVHAFDAADDVGGTWFWNRYPGARFDSEAYIYQYLFDEKLYKDWSWSQRFPGQPEIERWMHYVTDRLDLRKDIQFGTRITPRTTTRVGAVGPSTPTGATSSTPSSSSPAPGCSRAPAELPGHRVVQRAARVHVGLSRRGPDLAGKRVGVIGIGATGIQVIQTIAPEVGHLTVFARTPQYMLPMKNPTYGPEDQSTGTRAGSRS